MSDASPQSPPSPCIGVCRLDAAGAMCLGCFRTLVEIGDWSGADAARRQKIVSAAEERRFEQATSPRG
ncbi:DUF1289 domain-containing protein [uncultured Sphingomonas sp.]|uniref:DUF1289 domain-containing protein n=1 Tax=Sphingomonas sp. 179-A 4D3 NHS TaxID=3374291 RepID=UPI0025FC3EB7|nr:DUF1289 domain-containing protein [uncultured Sphingomonas sp.]